MDTHMYPPGAHQLLDGEFTLVVFDIDGPILPGRYTFGWMTGMEINVMGPNNLPPGTYKVQAQQDGAPAAEATLFCRMTVAPHASDDPYRSKVGNSANGTITLPDGSWLHAGTYDLVLQI
jgi:hypothetical protein